MDKAIQNAVKPDPGVKAGASSIWILNLCVSRIYSAFGFDIYKPKFHDYKNKLRCVAK
jgi:hypothetical protein